MDSYGALYRRHHAAALSLASYLASDHSLALDFTAEAFTRVLRVIAEGRGCVAEFRPYLLRSVRNVAYEHFRKQRRVEVVEDIPEQAAAADTAAEAMHGENRRLIAVAFQTLPRRSQQALWLSHVSGLSNEAIGERMRLSPGAVAVLTFRARESLRREYLRAHLRRTACPSECGSVQQNLCRYVRGSLTVSQREQVETHLATCASCNDLIDDLQEVNSSFRADALVPLCLVLLSEQVIARIAAGSWWGWLQSSTGMKAVAALNAAAVTTAVVAGVHLAQVGSPITVADRPPALGQELAPSEPPVSTATPDQTNPSLPTSPRAEPPTTTTAEIPPAAPAPPLANQPPGHEDIDVATPAPAPPQPSPPPAPESPAPRDEITVTVSRLSLGSLLVRANGTTARTGAVITVRLVSPFTSFLLPAPGSPCQGVGTATTCAVPASGNSIDRTWVIGLAHLPLLSYTVNHTAEIDGRVVHTGQTEIDDR